MEYDFQFERFRNIYEFDKAINERANNAVMAERHSSQKLSGWSGTSTYEEAEELLTKGWGLKVEEMKNELGKFSNKIERVRVRNKASMAGHAPIVAAAIKGVPKAMWATERRKVNEKKRCLHIYFNNTGSADESSEDLMSSGMAVLKLCVMLEKFGVKVKIDILPYVATNGNSVYGCGITIKDYQQPFNLKKMAYPIAHTSIFRRQGFKWLETMKNCSNSAYSYGYGQVLHSGQMENEFRKAFKMDDKGSVYITFTESKSVGFDPQKLAELKGIMVQ